MIPARYAALAAVVVSMGVGGGVAYAASGNGTTTTPSTTTPSTTAPSHSSSNCPNMGDKSGSSSSGAAYVPSMNL